MPTYTDSNRHPIHVGNRLGAGGEGTVYEILNHPGLVAKIYKESLSLSRVEKLKVMPSMGTSSLLAMTAWPQGLIYEGGKPCGLLMGRVTGYKDIHNLYSPRGRKIEFAKADFPFLVHAAANLARAFASIHESGTVIGDVNPGGVMVSPTDATVKLIDCDSFQVSSGTRKFLCDVGVPIFTPPELQEKPLKGVLRSANHDNFGLAVLLFHILFMGFRHLHVHAIPPSGAECLSPHHQASRQRR